MRIGVRGGGGGAGDGEASTGPWLGDTADPKHADGTYRRICQPKCKDESLGVLEEGLRNGKIGLVPMPPIHSEHKALHITTAA